jgi:2'-5' RNA ligase
MKQKIFIALNLGIAPTRAVAEVVEAVRREVAPLGWRVAWVPAANLHVTVKYLGWTRPETVEAIADRLRKLVGGRAPVELRARGLGAFPGPSSPRVIWVGLDGDLAALERLAADVDAAMSELGFTKEERAFRAHVTIGRVKEGKGSLTEIIAKYADRDCGTSTIRELVVYESKVRAQGAEYLARARVPLGGGAAAEQPAKTTEKEEAHDGTR